MARSAWPFAHMPDAYEGQCTECGRRGVVIPVRDLEAVDLHGQYLTGAHALLCWPCLGRDGDPLHRLR